MNITEKLIQLRKDNNLTQEQLSEKLALSISSIRNYENKKNPRIPKNEILIQLANFYNVSTQYLLNDSINNKSDENIVIANELGLSDLSIKNIKEIKDSNLQDSFNFFIENLDTSRLSKYIYGLRILHQYWTTHVCFLLKLHEFSSFLTKNIQKKPIHKDVSMLFSLFSKKMSEFCVFIESADGIYSGIDVSLSLSYKRCLQEIQDIFISGNIEEFKNKLIEYTHIGIAINEKFEERIDFIRYQIHTLTNNFLESKIPNFCNSDFFYYKDLKNYYKYMNSSSPLSNVSSKYSEKFSSGNYLYNNILYLSEGGAIKHVCTRTNKK